MRVVVGSKDLSNQQVDLAVCFAHEEDTQPRGIADVALRRELAREMQAEGFRGRIGDHLVWNANGRYPSRRFLVVGLGPKRGSSVESVRSAKSRIASAVREVIERIRAEDG